MGKKTNSSRHPGLGRLVWNSNDRLESATIIPPVGVNPAAETIVAPTAQPSLSSSALDGVVLPVASASAQKDEEGPSMVMLASYPSDPSERAPSGSQQSLTLAIRDHGDEGGQVPAVAELIVEGAPEEAEAAFSTSQLNQGMLASQPLMTPLQSQGGLPCNVAFITSQPPGTPAAPTQGPPSPQQQVDASPRRSTLSAPSDGDVERPSVALGQSTDQGQAQPQHSQQHNGPQRDFFASGAFADFTLVVSPSRDSHHEGSKSVGRVHSYRCHRIVLASQSTHFSETLLKPSITTNGQHPSGVAAPMVSSWTERRFCSLVAEYVPAALQFMYIGESALRSHLKKGDNQQWGIAFTPDKEEVTPSENTSNSEETGSCPAAAAVALIIIAERWGMPNLHASVLSQTVQTLSPGVSSWMESFDLVQALYRVVAGQLTVDNNRDSEGDSAADPNHSSIPATSCARVQRTALHRLAESLVSWITTTGPEGSTSQQETLGAWLADAAYAALWPQQTPPSSPVSQSPLCPANIFHDIALLADVILVRGAGEVDSPLVKEKLRGTQHHFEEADVANEALQRSRGRLGTLSAALAVALHETSAGDSHGESDVAQQRAQLQMLSGFIHDFVGMLPAALVPRLLRISIICGDAALTRALLAVVTSTFGDKELAETFELVRHATTVAEGQRDGAVGADDGSPAHLGEGSTRGSRQRPSLDSEEVLPEKRSRGEDASSTTRSSSGRTTTTSGAASGVAQLLSALRELQAEDVLGVMSTQQPRGSGQNDGGQQNTVTDATDVRDVLASFTQQVLQLQQAQLDGITSAKNEVLTKIGDAVRAAGAALEARRQETLSSARGLAEEATSILASLLEEVRAVHEEISALQQRLRDTEADVTSGIEAAYRHLGNATAEAQRRHDEAANVVTDLSERIIPQLQQEEERTLRDLLAHTRGALSALDDSVRRVPLAETLRGVRGATQQ